MGGARRHVGRDGGFVLYFAVPAGYIDEHLRALLTSVFGWPPKVVTFGRYHRLYLAGSACPRLDAPGHAPVSFIVPTDDWPFLYLRGRSMTPFYLELIVIFATIAAVAVFLTIGRGRQRVRFDRPMFFFGLAFLLLETKSVTEMNLVWGSTWLTSAVVFGSILLMVLAGTLLMRWRPLPCRYAVCGLMA